MRQIFFCKIDQIQVVWETRIIYYCMPCLRARSKQKDDRTTVYTAVRSTHHSSESSAGSTSRLSAAQVGFAEFNNTADNRANIGGTIIGAPIVGQ